jgi:hypothetical protein
MWSCWQQLHLRILQRCPPDILLSIRTGVAGVIWSWNDAISKFENHHIKQNIAGYSQFWTSILQQFHCRNVVWPTKARGNDWMQPFPKTLLVANVQVKSRSSATINPKIKLESCDFEVDRWWSLCHEKYSWSFSVNKTPWWDFSPSLSPSPGECQGQRGDSEFCLGQCLLGPLCSTGGGCLQGG